MPCHACSTFKHSEKRRTSQDELEEKVRYCALSLSQHFSLPFE